jgi:hypothetical protein
MMTSTLNRGESVRRPRLLFPVSWEATLAIVRLVPHYASHASITLSSIQTFEIQSLARFVRQQRLDFAASLLEQMSSAGIPPFMPVAIRWGTIRRIVVPPVVESHLGRFFLMDGSHRIWLARHSRLRSISVVRVDGLDVPLPSRPVPWDEVRIRHDHYSTEENLVDFDRSLFRPVTTTFNGPKTLF